MIFSAVGLAVVLVWAGFGLTRNTEHCLPVGLYALTPALHIRRGDIVQFCPPDNSLVQFGVRRGWLGRDGACPGGAMPMLKEVDALPGDTVQFTRSAVLVNGQPLPSSASRLVTLAGVRIPRVAFGTYSVPAGDFLAMGKTADAFDSRYFGFLPLSVIEHEARKL